MIKLTATSFATRQDLAEFARRVCDGMSAHRALNYGDNGIGAWGDPTWKPHGPPMCALPRDYATRNRPAVVSIQIDGERKAVRCICTDISPAGIVDLNPAALLALGFEPDADVRIEGAEVVLSDLSPVGV